MQISALPTDAAGLITVILPPPPLILYPRSMLRNWLHTRHRQKEASRCLSWTWTTASSRPTTRGGGGGGGKMTVMRPAASVGRVEISVFGPGRGATSSSRGILPAPEGVGGHYNGDAVEFMVVYHPHGGGAPVVVRRSYADLRWLHDTFTSHKSAGGTLCGRVLPPFPRRVGSGVSSRDYDESFPGRSSGAVAEGGRAAMAVATAGVSAGVGMIKAAAKSLPSFLGGKYGGGSGRGKGGGSSSPPSSDSASTSMSSPTATSPAEGGTRRDGVAATAVAGKKIDGGSSSLAKLGRGIRTGLKKVHYGVSGDHRSPDENSSAGKARQLERYLNYLLEHPALSTSFPLNTTLRASRSGLDSAKRMLDEFGRHEERQRQLKDIAHIGGDGDGDRSSMYLLSLLPSGAGGGTSSSPFFASSSLDLSWVRTAAQAAMALRVHGILETAGAPSASAKLQHASLPRLKKALGDAEDGRDSPTGEGDVRLESGTGGCAGGGGEGDMEEGRARCFESGVVRVETEGDVDGGGYDLLPLPLPPSQISVLCAGSSQGEGITRGDGIVGAPDVADRYPPVTSGPKMGSVPMDKFFYGNRVGGGGGGGGRPGRGEGGEAILGDMSVDGDIDRLREIIGSVDDLLGRCLAAGSLIGEKRRKRAAIATSVIRNLDSWEGARGEIVSQRALLGSVTMLDRGDEASERSHAILNQGE